MEITVDARVPYPRAQVFEAMREKMPDLVPFLPNVDAVEVKSRDDAEPGTIKLVNLWRAAKTEVPTVARPFIDPSRLNWLDHAVWTEADWTCRWRLEVGFMTERTKVGGTTTYTEDGPTATLVRMRGNLELDLKGLLPGFVARSAQPKVEAFVVKLIQPNFEKTVDALTRYLDTQRAQPAQPAQPKKSKK